MTIKRKRKLRTRLVIFTFSTILFTILICGVAIDVLLNKIYAEDTTAELRHSYEYFRNQIKNIKDDMVVQSSQIAKDDPVIALTSLVNRYQDKQHYQSLVFDNDKKNLAKYLLKQISLTKSDQVVIYTRDGNPLAFAIQKDKNKQIGITTYHEGVARYLVNNGEGNDWLPADLPDSIDLKLSELDQTQSFLSYSGKINYRSTHNMLVMESNRLVMREASDKGQVLLGLVRIIKSLDEEYFSRLSDSEHAHVSFLLSSGVVLNNRFQVLPENLVNKSSLYGTKSQTSGDLLKHQTHYIHSYVWPTEEGRNYLIVSYPKIGLAQTLNSTRLSFLFIFIFTAFIVIGAGLYWLDIMINKPIDTLVAKASQDMVNGYPSFPGDFSSYEISHLGKVLNQMVDVIKKRESQLLLSEQQLRNAQKLAKLGNWELDHKTGEMTWSDEVYTILGLDSEQTIPSYSVMTDLIFPDDLELVFKTYESSMAEHVPYKLVHRLRLNDGTIKYVQVYAETEYDGNEPVISSGTIQDVTEQAEKDEQLRRTQKMDALGMLTGGIAHDFNNMMGVVIGYCELLKEGVERDFKYMDYIDQIDYAAERASKLTNKLLTFSRKDDSGAVQVDLNQLLRDEQHMLEKTMTVRIRLVLELEDNIWELCLNRDELEDAILNMCINAMHAMPDGGELTLATRNVSLGYLDVQGKDISAGDYVLLTLTDTGVGMDQETLDRVFEPFYSTKKEKGTGLGMSQVYGFVQRSKGGIDIYSEPGHGTRISLYFPRSFAAGEQFAADEKRDIIDLQGAGELILVVDDEEALRCLADDILTSHGYTVLTAENAEQALRILQENKSISLIISDVIMPGMDGYQLADKVRAMYPAIKIQMASGYADVFADKLVDAGLHEQRLQKPFSSSMLLERVKYLLSEKDVLEQKQVFS